MPIEDFEGVWRSKGVNTNPTAVVDPDVPDDWVRRRSYYADAGVLFIMKKVAAQSFTANSNPQVAGTPVPAARFEIQDPNGLLQRKEIAELENAIYYLRGNSLISSGLNLDVADRVSAIITLYHGATYTGETGDSSTELNSDQAQEHFSEYDDEHNGNFRAMVHELLWNDPGRHGGMTAFWPCCFVMSLDDLGNFLNNGGKYEDLV